MLSSIAIVSVENPRCPTTGDVSGKHRPPADVLPSVRPLPLASLLALALGAACSPPPRFWSRREPTATPALRPLTAEAVIAAPVATDPDGAFASADGRSRSRQGPCQRDAREADRVPADEPMKACTFTPGRGWHEWTFPEPGVLLDVFDRVALVARTNRDGDVDVMRYDINLGRATRLMLPEPTARWARAGFTRSGMLAGLVRTGTADRPGSSWVRGATDGTLTMSALPFDADDLGTTDDLTVCVGPGGAALVSAVGWSRRIDLPATSTATQRPRADVARAGERVVCAMGQCVIDGVARVVLDPSGGGVDPAAADIH